jgi:hypothetical protein
MAAGDIASQWADPNARARLVAGKLRAVERMQAGEGFIYLAEIIDRDMVKIGFSLNPRRRMSHHHLREHGTPRLMATVPGTILQERQLHQALKAHQIAPRHGWRASEYYPISILIHSALPEAFRSSKPNRRSAA